MERPTLMREVGKVAWLFLSVTAAVGSVLAVFAWLMSAHPIGGMIAFYCFLLAVSWPAWFGSKTEAD